MIWLRLQAPFAAFRTFTAGWYRPTAGFLTPSAAYGLAMNLAGIDTRRDDGLSAMTVTKFGLPRAQVAIGAEPGHSLPEIQTLFQQLHNYPVGASGKGRKDDAKGSKYNITPVRREFLSDLHAMVVMDFPDRPSIGDEIRAGLAGEPPRSGVRYGLPFLGDNNFLIDKVEVLDCPTPARWFRRLGAAVGPAPDSTRLTSWIDRQDMSKTKSALYAPDEEATEEIPEEAWTPIDPPRMPA